MNDHALAFIVVLCTLSIMFNLYWIWLKTANSIVEEASEELDYRADYEHELTQPRWRIKLTTKDGSYYTDTYDPFLFLGTLKELSTSEQVARRRLSNGMSQGYFTTSSGIYIPTCSILWAEVIKCEEV